jgi:cardiolipin synthase
MRAVNFISHNDVTLLHCGAQYFPALKAAIESATREIYLETYIFADDDTGRMIEAALIGAAARGVTVNIITDWHGTGPTQVHALDLALRHAKVNHRAFNPWFRRGVARSHRKICVIDQQQAFVGGLNLNDDMRCDFDSRVMLPKPRWDFAVQISGPLVAAIHQETHAQWARLGRLALIKRIDLYRQLRLDPPDSNGRPTIAGFVVRDNLRNRQTIQRAYLQAMGAARHSVVLANPYFAPGRKFKNALASAALRGVQVTLLIGTGQFRLQDAVAHAFYPQLLKCGVKLVEYRATQLHGKVAVIDDEWATVGSSNCDGLSLFLNQEANVVVRDAAFARTLRDHIDDAIAEGVLIKQEDFDNIGWTRRLWYATAYLVYKGLMRIATFGHYS